MVQSMEVLPLELSKKKYALLLELLVPLENPPMAVELVVSLADFLNVFVILPVLGHL